MRRPSSPGPSAIGRMPPMLATVRTAPQAPPRPSNPVAERLMALSEPAHYLSLVAGLAVLLYLTRHTWFFNDEFAFFARMQPGHSLGLLVPYQEQWSTVPHLLWRWMRRVGTDPWVATALAAVFLVVGGGAEELSIWFQVTFEMSVALGLIGALLVDHDGQGKARDVGFWPIAVIGLM